MGKVGKPRPGDKISRLKEEVARQENTCWKKKIHNNKKKKKKMDGPAGLMIRQRPVT